jgi:hypothetical protein
MKGPFVGDVGTELLLDTLTDLAGATIRLAVRKPDGTRAEWDAEAYPAAGAGVVRHTVRPGEFDGPGVYQVQPLVEKADGSFSLHGWPFSFRVFPLI